MSLFMLVALLSAPQPQGKIAVVATIPPLAAIAREVGGSRVTVYTLVPFGSDPHQYAPTPRDIEVVRGCDVLLTIGTEPFLASIGSGGRIRVGWSDWISAGAYVRNGNPHYLWLYPKNAAVIAGVIAQALSSIDPEGSEYYELRLREFEAEVSELIRWAHSQVKFHRASGARVVLAASHFEPLVEALGLKPVATVIHGGEEHMPSPKEVSEAASKALELKAEVIIVLATAKGGDEDRVARAISEQTGIPVVYMWGIPASESDTYTEFMKYTITSLLAGIQASRTASLQPEQSFTLEHTIILMMLALNLALSAILIRQRMGA